MTSRCTRLRFALPCLLLAAACGSDEQSPIDAAPTFDGPPTIDAPPPADAMPSPDADTSGFLLTSVDFVDGMIGVDQTCDGMNFSPKLAWTAWPGAASYGVVLNDVTFDFLHSAIYDVDGAATLLPSGIERVYAPASPAGTHQAIAYDGNFGYAGPCPPSVHTYELVLYALDVATLPGVDNTSTASDVEAALVDHALATTRLTGTYTPF